MTDQEKYSLIEREVCTRLGVDPECLSKPSHKREYFEARGWVWLFVRRYSMLTFAEISKRYTRHHSTVIATLKVMDNLIEYNGFKAMYLELNPVINDLISIKFDMESWATSHGDFLN